jgi:FdrA protein
MLTQTQTRPGTYYDSVVLMQLQKALADLPGIIDAGVVMATPANLDLLAASDLPGDSQAGSDDLLIVVKAENETAAQAALNQVDSLMAARRSTAAQAFRPRSLASAVRQIPDAQWVLISVPGRYAAEVARSSLDLGKNVFLYSDNVSLEDEIALKQNAAEKGLLVMGPDCGTAIINGVGLGFANRVRRGNIGLVGASGTGLQAITSEVHNLGGGVSQAIGTGGRDLKAAVGAITAHQGLNYLIHDPETAVIVLVSKPPAAEVAARLLTAARQTDKPVVVNFIGYPPPGRQIGNLYFAAGLIEAAELAVHLSQNPPAPAEKAGTAFSGCVRGLFSGGTLAYEALLGLQAILTPLYSNVPIHESQQMADPLESRGHTILDLGEDIFTQGRLHPMMDNDLRLRRLRQEAADPDTGLILIDVVLGEGAHPNPAAELNPAIAEVIQEGNLPVVVVVVGTEDDPQNIADQIEQLEGSGAVVFRKLPDALNYIAGAYQPDTSTVSLSVNPAAFQSPFAAINVGLESFSDSLTTQEARVVQVEWRPPAGGNEKLMALLAKMK